MARLSLFIAGLCLLALAGCSSVADDSAPAASIQTAHTQTIACVGDSNTAGYGAESYAGFLADRLGDGYSVENYGVSGTTAMASGAYPYSETAAYDASLAAQPDIVVLMFGTNDTASWHGADAFAREYDALVQSYLALEPQPRLILCTPPAPHLDTAPGMVSFGVQPACYDAVNSAIRTTADKHSLTLVDIYTLTSDHPDWFLDDGIHLDNTGAQAVADAVTEAVEG